jgi:hypothetical protein
MSYSINTLYQAIRDNNESAVQVNIENGVIPDIAALNESIIYNNQNIINLILNTNLVQPDLASLNITISRHNLFMFDLLLDKYNISPDDSTMNEFIINLNFINEGNSYILNKLIKKNVIPTLNTLILCLYGPNLEIVKIICEYVSAQILYVEDITNIDKSIYDYLINNKYQIEQQQNNNDDLDNQ